MDPTRPLSEMTAFQPDEPFAHAVTVAYEPLAFTVMTCVALPTLTGTGKSGAVAGAGAVCVFSVPPAAGALEPSEDADALPDGDAEAEGDADAAAEAELLGEADEAGASDAKLLELGTTSAAAGESWPPRCPHADARNIAQVAASAAEKLRDEGSTK
ncbi:hypothetical protein ACH492_37440 [Streptomyces sp. NPDC019443]|uniref:hypothetical protein n=1 Tax=Streptomyces sp. NPDC019443 TaxID=3365061 RepID=UPI0037AD5E8F